MTTEYIVIKIGGVASKQLTPEILANCPNGIRLVKKLLSSMGVVSLLIS